MPIIRFLHPHKDRGRVSEYTQSVLLEIMKNSGIHSLTITSTARTVDEQARVMYQNIKTFGVDQQKRLYADAGDQVIDEYSKYNNMNRSKEFVISKMKAKITELNPSKISHHIADFKILNVIDIAPSSIPTALRPTFVKAITDDLRISQSFVPPNDPAYHLEIPQVTGS